MGSCCAPRGLAATEPPSVPVPQQTPTSGLRELSSRPTLVPIPAQRFLMGDDSGLGFLEDGEGPVREVTLDGFLLAATTVTNAQFSEFVAATGYVTDAETFGWSYVFADLMPTEGLRFVLDGAPEGTPWWLSVRGASWATPLGPTSDVDGLSDHPVVHVSYNDAQAYCRWAGGRLPTEAEWECAARGGLVGAVYPWGDELEADVRHHCNVWQGTFPVHNTGADGYLATAPADAYEPNGYGLYNTSGNVWEWCQDWWSPTWHLQKRVETRQSPRGPADGGERVIRGGSYLCHDSYCTRYRVAARTSNSPESTTGHMGFRMAADLPTRPGVMP